MQIFSPLSPTMADNVTVYQLIAHNANEVTAMQKKKESCERSVRSQDRLSGLEQLLYEVYYRRKMFYDEGRNASGDAAENSYAVVMPRILATLLRRTRLLLLLSGCVLGLLLADLISRALF